MAEVNPELRVPFALDPIHAEMWLREEKPTPARLEELVETQPESARPALRRLLDQAQAAIEADADVEVMRAVDDELDEDTAELEVELDDDDQGYEGMTVEDLKDEIRKRNEGRDEGDHLLVSGLKEELIERLEEDDRANLPTAKDEAEAQASSDAIDALLDDEEG